jgi:hypothetical protein
MTDPMDLTSPTTAPVHPHPRTGAALERLRRAMSDIEADISLHKGVYPFNHGRVTQSELCRRADVKKATLQNQVHKDTTRVEIIRWLDALNLKLTQTRASTRDRVTAIADDLVAEVQRLTQANADMQEQLGVARRRVVQLERESPTHRAQQSSTSMPQAPTATQFTSGTKLRHYKGGLYCVVSTCLIESTLKPGVLYKPLQGDKQETIWMRPMAEFQDMVPTESGPVPRFVLITESQ